MSPDKQLIEQVIKEIEKEEKTPVTNTAHAGHHTAELTREAMVCGCSCYVVLNRGKNLVHRQKA
jgi:hypothetical protein